MRTLVLWREIMKGDKLGRQSGSGSQEQPKSKIMKGDKLGRQRNHEGRQAWETRRRQPRATQKGDHEGRQAWETSGSGSHHEARQAWETRRQRQPMATHKGNHGSDRFRKSATSLRRKKPYSFQLSDGKNYPSNGPQTALILHRTPDLVQDLCVTICVHRDPAEKF